MLAVAFAFYLVAAGAQPPAVRRTPDSLAEARELLTAGSIDASIALLREAIARQPGSSDAYLLLGTALSLVPRRTEAIAALEKAVELQPGSARAHHTLGLAFGRFGEPGAAQASFEKAIALDANFAEAHINLALILAQRKNYSSALLHLDRAIRNRKDAYPHYLKGKILNEQDRPAEAAAAFEQAVRLRPGYAEAFLSLGLTQRKLLQDDRALASFERAAKLSPDNAAAQAELGKQYLSAGNPVAAIPCLTVANRLQPNERSTLYSLIRALRAAGRTVEAQTFEAHLKLALQASGDRSAVAFKATALNNQGVELEKSGKTGAALEKYRAALELDPENPGFRRNLALGLCRLGRWKEGIAELREILRQNPNDEEATRALYLALDEAGVR